ncbi:MAG: phage baseplate assembly protein V [Chitinophagaceae bacterium]
MSRTQGNGTPLDWQHRSDVVYMYRLFTKMMQWGEVVQADYDAGKVRVRLGAEQSLPGQKAGRACTVSPWLPVPQSRAGANRSWAMPEIGDQVMIMCPNGEVAQGVIGFHVGCANHSPNAAKSPDVQRSIWGNNGNIFDNLFDDIDRAKKHRHQHLPSGGRYLVTIGKDHASGACIDASEKQISLRIGETSLVIYPDRVEIQVNGQSTQFQLTAESITAIVAATSKYVQTGGGIDMSVGESGQVSITAEQVLARVESTVQNIMSGSIIQELVEQKVKAVLEANGLTLQAEKASVNVESAGNVALNANGSSFKLTAGDISGTATSVKWSQGPSPAPAYSGGQTMTGNVIEFFPIYEIPVRPTPELGGNPYTPDVSKSITSDG